MSLALYIVPERPLPADDYFVNGKALAHSPDRSRDRICRELGVRPLTEFLSQDPEESRAFLEDEGIDPPDEGFPAEQWFEAADGLKTVRALIGHLTAHPKAVPDSVGVLSDLREYETILTRLANVKIRWHLAVDY